MSAPLIFVRDGRTLPFIPITVAALRAIRRTTSRAEAQTRRPYVTATYMALLEFANEDRTDRVALPQRDLVERVGAGRTTVQAALAELVEAEVLQVSERHHGAGRLENEYVVVEPGKDGAENCTPARVASDPRPCGEQRITQEEQQENIEGAGAKLRISGRPVKAEVWRRTCLALQEFNQQAGKSLAAVTGEGDPSEAAKRIYSRLAAWPDLDDPAIADVIRRTLLSRWWGSDPPSVGVVFGPKVFEENLSRAGTPVAGRSATVGHAMRGAERDFSRFDRSIE